RGEKQAGRKESTINQLANSMVTLTRNYRFGDNSGIDPLCQAIRTGDGEGVLQLLQRGTYSHIRFTPLKEITDLKQSLSATEVVNVYRKAMSEPLPFASLEAFNQGRILCAIKGGTAGMTSINRTIESILREEGLVGANRFLYDRRPVIIQRNDYSIRLFNGDVGILREDPGDGRLYAHFPAGSQNTRRTLAVRLPDHESAFAITIHRSQGSEFDHVLVILPPNPSPILTRELLYTAVSRAKQSVTIWANPETIRWACNRQVRRSSGLSDQILRHLSSS
ncbi:MAG: ATP-binding domain-containing protein, partial [Verrucomicrobiae bacterium]|nr:ATP-binding domain-containing protein [Verrucomicrobiae bacterium]